MKFSKKIMILLFMSFFVSGIIFTVESSRDLNLNIDISNAIQKIGSIILYTGGDEGTELGILTSDENDKLKITGSGDNFIINYRNDITDSEYSSILGGTGNEIHGGKYSTVYGGVGNDIQSDYSVILGGRDNTVHSNSTGSVIVGNNNKVNSLSRSLENSVVVGNNNEMNGSYSSVVGYNSTVGIGENGETYNSVAMGSGAMVIGNNSFLRVDGSETVDLYNDEVFVVFGEKGMAVNESAPNDKAKFNVGSRFILDMGNTGGEENGNLSDSIVCGSGNGTGIVKIEDRDDIEGQKCLCNCDGQGWKSMIGDGQCEAICKGEKSDVFPECVTGGIELIQLGDKKEYSGGCIGGSAIKTSFFMPGDTMWWQCQGKNGNTTRCSYKSECTGNIPGLEDGAVEINNNLVPPIGLNKNTYKYSTDKSEVCTYSCKAGYALDGIHRCSKVCNESSKSCNLGSIKYLNNPTYTNDYKYGCLYDNELFECEANCDDGKIWNGDHCIDSTNVCGTTRYQCFIGRVSNTGTDSQNFMWDCVDERENIIESCHIAKQVVDRVVYYNYIRDGNGQNVSFYMTGDDIPVDIKIKQTYTYNNGSMTDIKIYTIKAHDKVSDNGLFNQGIILGDKGWYTGTNDYTVKNNELFVVDTDKVYRLRIEDYNGLCANNCSTAGQCLRGGKNSNYNFHGNKTWSVNNGDEYMFQWTCKLGNTTEECETRCPLDAGKCGSVGTINNSVNCDPSSDSECNIWGTGNVRVNDFYMDKSEEKIVGSECGIKRHCHYYVGTGVICTESIENCQQKGFKCKNNYVLSGCSCVPKSSICLSNTNPGSCANGTTATGYSKGEGKTTYSYYCQKEGMERVWCEASCSNGKIWNGTSCIVVPEMCGEKHNNCINQSVLKSNQKDDYAKKYKRTCGLGSNTKECSECYSGYIMSGDVCVVKPAIDCEATSDYNGYKVPYLANGNTKQVEKNTRNSVCKLQVKCETGVLRSYATGVCINVCNTGTNLGTCITGLSVNYPYKGNRGDSTYMYECKNNSGYTFDSCIAECPAGQYWDGSRCGNISPNLCGESHYDCINGGVSVANNVTGTVNNGYTTYFYRWKCKLGEYQTGCSETLNVAHNCKGGTYSGYYIRNNMSHNQELSVNKTVGGVKCTATAVCGSGTISIRNEDCTNACPGGILDVPKCNFNGVNPVKLSATWTSGYTYKCGESLCSANCSSGKIWNGNGCVSHYGPYCRNDVALSCTFGNAKQVQSGIWGSTWNCSNVNNENMNESICYKCNDGYEWISEKNKCEEKSCSSMSKNGYSIPGLTGSTSVTVKKNIANGSCTASANCSKGKITLAGEVCTCSDGYYLSGKVCNSICGDGYSTPCNGPYSAVGIERFNGYSIWGHEYMCNRNNNLNSLQPSQQCSCDGLWWDGSRCQGLSSSLCNASANQCDNSVLVETTGGNRGNIWKCGIEGFSEECYKCNEGYQWNGLTCEKIVVPIDGECSYDGYFCSAGRKQITQVYDNGNGGYEWNCIGENGGDDETNCSLKRVVSSTSSCERNSENEHCGGMYTNSDTYTKLECESAGSYRGYSKKGGYSDFKGPFTCWMRNSNGVNGLINQSAWSSNVNCIEVTESLNVGYSDYAYEYDNCLQRNTNETKSCYKNDERMSNNNLCNNVLPKMQQNHGGTCGSEKYECVQGTLVNRSAWGDDDNGYTWKCSENGRTTTCYNRGNYCCHLKDQNVYNNMSWSHSTCLNTSINKDICENRIQGGGFCTWSC